MRGKTRMIKELRQECNGYSPLHYLFYHRHVSPSFHHCQATKINPVYWRRVTSIWMCEKPTRQDLWWLQEKKIPSTEIEFTESLEMLVKAIYLKKVFHEQESLESLISVWILLVKTPVETRTFKYPMEKIINIKVSVLSDAVSNGCDSGGIPFYHWE